jgi:HlyD family secretion protein
VELTVPRKKQVCLGVAALAVLAGLLYWLVWERQEVAKELRLFGHIEATETDLSFKVSGKINLIHFDEGDWIKAGQVVAELEAEDLKAEVANAEARLANAKANLEKYEAGYRPQEVKEAEAQAAKTKADLADKEADFQRYQKLFERKVVSASTRDSYEAAYLMAKEAHQSARESLSLRREGFRKEEIEQARAEYKQAGATLDLAKTRLAYATIYAPVTGVVLARPAQPGQVAAVGATVITMGDLDNIYFEGYIPETDLARVRYGQKAVITTDTYPGKKYPAWVSFINSKAEFTPKTVETFKERVTLVYRTKIRADNPDYELKPGMPAEAVIFLDSQPQ